MPDRDTPLHFPQPNPDTNLMFELAKRKMAEEMPDQFKAATIQPMGAINKFLHPDAEAVTSPFNTISYNPKAALYKNQEEVNDMLAHELTHVRQNQETPVLSRLYNIFISNLGAYQQRPQEMEAFQTEKDRALRDHRPGIQDVPNFQDNDIPAHGDIQLYPPKKSRTGN